VSKSKESNKSNRVKTKYCEDILAILGTRKKEFKISAPSEEQKQSWTKGAILEDFKLYERTIVTKTAWRPVQQSKDTERKPYNCSYLIFDKVPKTYTGEKTASSTSRGSQRDDFHAVERN
jgi:hypothetical protein